MINEFLKSVSPKESGIWLRNQGTKLITELLDTEFIRVSTQQKS